MPYNPKSLAGLTRAGKGQPKKNRVKKLLSLSLETAKWLESQPKQGEAIDKLVELAGEKKMKRYKVELIKEFDYPDNSLEWLNSPLGVFCREMHHKQWLEADEGSIGHLLMMDFLKVLDMPDCFRDYLYEVDLASELQEDLRIRGLYNP